MSTCAGWGRATSKRTGVYRRGGGSKYVVLIAHVLSEWSLIMVKTVTISELNFIFLMKSLESKKKKLALTSWWFMRTYLHRPIKTLSHIEEHSKMLNIISKYFSFFKSTPPTSWVAHITGDFHTCYSCLYYKSIVLLLPLRNMIKWFMNTYLHKAIMILQFISHGTIQKCLT